MQEKMRKELTVSLTIFVKLVSKINSAQLHRFKTAAPRPVINTRCFIPEITFLSDCTRENTKSRLLELINASTSTAL